MRSQGKFRLPWKRTAGTTKGEVRFDDAQNQAYLYNGSTEIAFPRLYQDTVPTAKAFLNANTNHANGDLIAFNAKAWDTVGNIIASPITNTQTIRQAGKYLIVAQVTDNATAAANEQYIRLLKNGAQIAFGDFVAGTSFARIAEIVDCAVGDTIQVQLASSSLRVITGGEQYTHVELLWLGGPGPSISEVGTPAARAGVSGGTQLFAPGASAVLLLPTEDFDTDQMHDTVTNTGRFTIRTPGVYSIEATMTWNVSTGGDSKIEVLKNGAAVSPAIAGGNSRNGSFHTLAGSLKLAAGDYIEIRAVNATGGNLTAVDVSVSVVFEGSGKTVIPRARATRSAAQTIQSNVGTKVLLDAIVNGEDNDAIFDAVNNRFVIKTAGTYAISGQVTFAPGSGDYRSADVLVNGAYKSTNGGVYASGTYGQRLQVGIAAIDLKVGDVVELYCQQNTSANTGLGISTGEGNTWLALAKYGMSGPGANNDPGWAQSGNDLQSTNSGDVKSGGAFRGKMIGFSAYRGVGQAVANNPSAPVVVQLNAEEWDSHNWFDSSNNYRYTPQVAGYYRFSANIHMQPGMPGGGVMAAFIRKNGVIQKQNQIQSGATTNWWGPSVSAVVFLNGTTDYVDLACSPSGAAVTIGGTNDASAVYLQGEFIGT